MSGYEEISEMTCPECYSERVEGRDYGRIEHVLYHSEITGRERGMNVVFPPGYDDNLDKSYPVLYYAHGMFGNEHVMLDDKNYKIVEILVNLAAAGKTREMIVVFPNIYVSKDPDMQPGFSIDTVGPYDDFIQELIQVVDPYVTAHYRTLTGRENRFVFGFSMGAREALYIGMSRPDLFAYVGGAAPTPGLIPGKDWAMEHPGMFTDENFRVADKGVDLKLLMFCVGEKDSVVGKFPIHYHEVLVENGVDHLWYLIPGVEHDERLVRSSIYNFAIRLMD